jgi:hypothetical protein
MTEHNFQRKYGIGPDFDKIYICIGPDFDKIYICKRCGKHLYFAATAPADEIINQNMDLYGDCDLDLIRNIIES